MPKVCQKMKNETNSNDLKHAKNLLNSMFVF